MKQLSFQPIPYQGSKRLLAPRICELFVSNIETLYEPFAGSAAVSIYAASRDLAKSYIISDILPELVELWRCIIERPSETSARYRSIWEEQFKCGIEHFYTVRSRYNISRDPIDLLYLIVRCVKNAIRFDKKGGFTQSVDKRRTGVHPDKMQRAIDLTSHLLKGRTQVFCGDFTSCIGSASSRDFIYLDPPYQGTTYGRDKRYAAQLERGCLIDTLKELNIRNVPFILSYDGRTGDKIYAAPLPQELDLCHIPIHAGRSSQATLSGRVAETIESLYLSPSVAKSLRKVPDYSKPKLPDIHLSLFP